MKSGASGELMVSFDGDSWQAVDSMGNCMPLTPGADDEWPELPEGASASMLLMPVEQLLCRSFALPLAQPRFVDADILAQELDEKTGEKPDRWWLAWRAEKDDGGVAGLVFGMPEALRLRLDADERWRHLRHVGVDAWSRLQAQMEGCQGAADADDNADVRPVAVFDEDADGLFFGVRAGGGAGPWRGMRRLNPGPNTTSSATAGQIHHSLAAMGWRSADAATGRLGSDLLAALEFETWLGETVATELPGRHAANLSLSTVAGLDFRHGQWGAHSGLAWLAPWRRTLNMAAGALLIWMLAASWQIQHLQAQAEDYRQRINGAFHRGLPNETVMIDALAQLRQAVNNAEDGSNSAGDWLRQIDAIDRVYAKDAWVMREISFREGAMQISGQAGDLAAMNRIRNALQQQTGRDVKLADTDLSSGHVAFRMIW